MHHDKTLRIASVALGIILTLAAGQVWSRAAMNVLTINTKDPMS